MLQNSDEYSASSTPNLSRLEATLLGHQDPHSGRAVGGKTSGRGMFSIDYDAESIRSVSSTDYSVDPEVKQREAVKEQLLLQDVGKCLLVSIDLPSLTLCCPLPNCDSCLVEVVTCLITLLSCAALSMCMSCLALFLCHVPFTIYHTGDDMSVRISTVEGETTDDSYYIIETNPEASFPVGLDTHGSHLDVDALASKLASIEVARKSEEDEGSLLGRSPDDPLLGFGSPLRSVSRNSQGVAAGIPVVHQQ